MGKKCVSGVHTYSRSMAPGLRKCVHCNHIEGDKEKEMNKFLEKTLKESITTVELSHFVGKDLILTGVDQSQLSMKEWGEDFGDCQVINFILNGVTYSAIENPQDGYRSSMREIRVVNDIAVANVFVGCLTRGRVSVDHEEIVEFVDIRTEKVVLEIGTRRHDDYYPSFVNSFSPENMFSNAKANFESIKALIMPVAEVEGWGSF